MLSVILLFAVIDPPIWNADQPPPGYDTAQVLRTVETLVGQVPVRRGFWDPDVVNRKSGKDGEGFGYDKAFNRHRVTDMNMIAFVLRSTNIGVNDDPDFDEGNDFVRNIRAVDCRGPVDNIPEICEEDELDIVAAVNLEDRDLYFDWPAGDPVGLQTVFCEGYDADVDFKCPPWVNSYIGEDA